MRRAVFDTTVLVGALLSPGGLADELLTLAAEEQFELILSSAIILETWRTLIASDHIRARYPYSGERTHIFCLSLDEIATPWTVKPTQSSPATRTCYHSELFREFRSSRPKRSGRSFVPQNNFEFAVSLEDAVLFAEKSLLTASDFFNYEWFDAEGGRHRLLG